MAESKKFDTGIVYADLDVARLNGERRRMTTFIQNEDKAYVRVAFENEVKTLELERYIDPRPFVGSTPNIMFCATVKGCTSIKC